MATTPTTTPTPPKATPSSEPALQTLAESPTPKGWQGHVHDLGLIVVQIHEVTDDVGGWSVSTSHGEAPKGAYATEVDAKKAADRVARAQLERSLSLLTAAEDLPRGGSRPRHCGVVLLRGDDDVAAVRRKVLAALSEVS